MTRKLDLLGSLRLLPRDLRLLFVSLFLWTFGIGLYTYLFTPFLIEDNGATPAEVGIVFLLGFLAAAFTIIPGGLLANKYDLKTVIILGWALSIPAPILYYFARTWIEAIPGFVLLQATAFLLPAFNAYIAAAAREGRVSSAFGITYSAGPLGIVLSPIVGGILLTWLSVRDLFLLAAIFFTLSTLVLLPLRPHPPIQEESSSRILEMPRSRHEKFLLLYITAAAVAFSVSSPFLSPFYRDLFALTNPQIQLAGAVQSLGGASLSILLGRRAETVGRGRTIAYGLILTTVGLLALVLLRNPFVAVPFIFLIGGGRAPALIAYSAISSLGGKTTRGGRFGVYLTLETLGIAVGPYIGGVLYALNPINVLTATAVSYIALAGLASLGIREEKAT